nr:zinc finger protein 768-like [Dermacentor andersoni]
MTRASRKVEKQFLESRPLLQPPSSVSPGSRSKDAGSGSGPRLVCRYCGYVSSNASYLAHHERTHTGERPFPCPVCPKAFNWKVDLKRHLRTHTGEKPFPCTLCGRSFRIRSHLTGHLRCHSTERPYRCTRCPMRFTQSSGLARHMHVHTEETPPA